MASVDWIPPRHGCDRWWLACTSNDSLNWLFAALAFGLIVYGLTLTAAIMSGAWFDREQSINARGQSQR